MFDFITMILDFFFPHLKKPAKPIIVPDEVLPPMAPPIVPPVVSPTYLWGDSVQAKHSVRLICDEEGLSLEQKNILCACLEVESGFNVNAMHQNKNLLGNITSTDWGIVQVNDYWHIGKGKDFPSVAFVLANPEADVRWMARLFKAGKMNLWVSYTSGAYLKFMV